MNRPTRSTNSDPAPALPLATGSTSRRGFLAAVGTAAAGVSAVCSAADGAADGAAEPQESPVEDAATVLDSPPVLQNPTPSSATVAWAVRTPATGWVEYGPTPELGRRADGALCGLNPFSDRFLAAQLSGLEPGQPVYYRVFAAPIHFHNAYRIERGEAAASEVYRFVPPNADAASASFAVINDTHQNAATLRALMEQIAAQPADFTIWNGDVFNDVYGDDQIVQYALRPAEAAFAAEVPLLFVAGNHDHRGPAARDLSRAFTLWSEPGDLGRCFAVRQGPLALIGLDTGEDKPDRHPVFAGLANFEPYRRAQRDWLGDTLRREEIAAAPHLVVFCHIPLRGLPGQNGGDSLEGYAAFCRQAQQLWAPLLAEAKAPLVISGHTHRFRYDPPNEEFPFAQLVGGGPQPERATLIRGQAGANSLEITARGLDGQQLGRWTYPPRA